MAPMSQNLFENSLLFSGASNTKAKKFSIISLSMGNSENLDFKKLGLKCGIEIHQQLASKQKLFCRCPAVLQGSREPDYMVERQHRPVLGETGEFDQAMLREFEKKNSVVYEGYFDSSCTYELDETPPFPLNEEALEIALEIAELFKMTVIPELFICRKNYVDGSVPGGFQRTITLATDGELPLAKGKSIGIEALFLEEDAARKVKEEDKKVYFRTDRLGIPLVEITTAPEIFDPQEAMIAAERIGLLLRSTQKVILGLGTIRQDLNISIAEGTRVEIKGLQKLEWIPALVRQEVERQVNLLKIRDELLKRKITETTIERNTPVDVSHIFSGSSFKYFKEGLEGGGLIKALKLEKFEGILGTEIQPNRRFGTELASKIKIITGLQGLVHSDEDVHEKYKFSETELNELKSILEIDTEKQDGFIVIVGQGARVDQAFDLIVDRLKTALKNVPPETRRAKEDGNTEFLRDLHGGSRLYPDTDMREVLITQKHHEKVQENLQGYLYPWEVVEAFKEKYKIAPEDTREFIKGSDFTLFKKLVEAHPKEASLVVTILKETIVALRRDGFPIDNLKFSHFDRLLTALAEGKVTKDAIPEILQIYSNQSNLEFKDVLEEAGIKSFDQDEIKQTVVKMVEANLGMVKSRGMGAMGALMGDLMKEFGRGSVDGKLLSGLLRAELQKHLGEKS